MNKGLRRAFALLVVASLGCIVSAQSPNWSRDFGNSQNTSVSAGKGCTGAPLWSANLSSGNLYPTADIVAGPEGNLYVPFDSPNSSVLNCYDSESGNLNWTFTDNVLLSPAVGPDGTVYVEWNSKFQNGGGDLRLYALDPIIGSTKWMVDLTATASALDFDSSPMVDKNGTVYVSYETGTLNSNGSSTAYANVLALSGATGANEWSYSMVDHTVYAESPPQQINSELALSPDETTLYLGRGPLSAFDAATGGLSWQMAPKAYPTDTGGTVTSPPVVGPDGTVYTLFDDAYGSGCLAAFDGQTGIEKWYDSEADNANDSYITWPSLSPNGKVIYVSGGYANSPRTQLIALDSSSGSALWTMDFHAGQAATGGAGGLAAQPAVASDGTLYLTDIENTVINTSQASTFLYAIDPSNQIILWTVDIAPGGYYNSFGFPYGVVRPTIDANGNIYVYGEDNGDTSAPMGTLLALGTTSLANFYVSSANVTGGDSANGVVQLNKPAGSLGASISLTSSNPNVTISSVETVPPGAKGSSFQILAKPVSDTETATLTANFGPMTRSATVTITPAALAAVAATPSTINAGSATGLALSLNGKAGPQGAAIALTSSSPALPVPASTLIASGTTATSITLHSLAVASRQTVTITATGGAISKQTTVTLVPNKLENFYVSPTSVIAGTSTRGVAQIELKAGAGGNTISLKSGTAAVQVPSTITIPAGSTGVSFPITTTQVPATLGVRLTATFGPYSLQTTLTVYPGLARIYVSPTSVVGGQTTHGVVQLSGKSSLAQTISLSSSDGLVGLPATVTIPAGSSGVSFMITTKAVSNATSVTLTAKEGASSETTTMTLEP